jgi:Fe-S cluster biogenesis protein NfuA
MLREKVEEALDGIRPALQADGGKWTRRTASPRSGSRAPAQAARAPR